MAPHGGGGCRVIIRAHLRRRKSKSQSFVEVPSRCCVRSRGESNFEGAAAASASHERRATTRATAPLALEGRRRQHHAARGRHRRGDTGGRDTHGRQGSQGAFVSESRRWFPLSEARDLCPSDRRAPSRRRRRGRPVARGARASRSRDAFEVPDGPAARLVVVRTSRSPPRPTVVGIPMALAVVPPSHARTRVPSLGSADPNPSLKRPSPILPLVEGVQRRRGLGPEAQAGAGARHRAPRAAQGGRARAARHLGGAPRSGTRERPPPSPRRRRLRPGVVAGARRPRAGPTRPRTRPRRPPAPPVGRARRPRARPRARLLRSPSHQGEPRPGGARPKPRTSRRPRLERSTHALGAGDARQARAGRGGRDGSAPDAVQGGDRARLWRLGG